MPGYPRRRRTPASISGAFFHRRRAGGLGPAPTEPLEQEGYRWRNDDGSETTATWKAAQDTSVTLALDARARLRFVVSANSAVAAKAYTLYYKLSTDPTWLPVPVGGAGPVVITPSSNITAGGEPTTTQLTPPT